METTMSATRPPDAVPHASPRKPATPWTRVLAVALGLTAGLSLLVIAFAWPATQLAPRSLPVVVAAPAEGVTQVRAALDQAAPGGFAVTTAPDEAAARGAIERREAY